MHKKKKKSRNGECRDGKPGKLGLETGKGIEKSDRWRCAQIMATMSMMKKALHIGTRDTERAARIFLEDLPFGWEHSFRASSAVVSVFHLISQGYAADFSRRS